MLFENIGFLLYVDEIVFYGFQQMISIRVALSEGFNHF